MVSWGLCWCSVTKSCPTLCDPMDCRKPGFPVLHCLPEFAQTHVHLVRNAIQPLHPLSNSPLCSVLRLPFQQRCPSWAHPPVDLTQPNLCATSCPLWTDAARSNLRKQMPKWTLGLDHQPADRQWEPNYYVAVIVLQSPSCVWLFVTPWTVAHQAPLSMRFSRQEYWSGLPFSSPGDLSDQGIEPVPPALVGRFFTTKPPGESIPVDTQS